MKQWNKRLVGAISHNYFFYSIVGLAILQGLWYAISVTPTFFDEQRHIDFIKLYLDHISPFIASQKPAWDALGEVTRDPSYLFYWLMSWPLRLVAFFTSDHTTQIIFLRLLCIGMFSWGLFLYRKVFLEINIPRAVIHGTLLLFILAPTIAVYPGSIHYDNLIFLLFAMALLCSIRILRSKTVDFQKLALLLSIGMVGSVVKFTFIALFAPIFVFLFVDIWRRFGNRFFPLLKESFLKLTLIKRIALSLVLIVSLGLFIERPVTNLIAFHQIQPDCIKRIGKERCKRNYTAERNISLLEKKPTNFKAQSPFDYSLQYLLPYTTTSHVSFATNLNPLPVMMAFYYVLLFATPVLILLYLRSFLQNKTYAFLLFVAGGYTVLLFLYLYLEYTKYGIPVATSSRYMVQVIPLFMLFAALGLQSLLKNHRATLLSLFVIALLAHTQGGGIGTYLLQANPRYEWKNPVLQKINKKLRGFAFRIIKQNGPFIR